MRGKSLLVVAALAGSLVALPMLGQAHGHGGKGYCSHGHHGMGFHSGVEHLEKLAQKRDVTDEQRGRIRAIADKFRPQTREVTDRLRAARTGMYQEMKADKPDETKIMTAAAEKGKAEGEMMVLRTKVRSEMNGVLTPEQRERWMKRGHDRFHKGDKAKDGQAGKSGVESDDTST
jgi:Spy/CpxP family protein refolding chaperone